MFVVREAIEYFDSFRHERAVRVAPDGFDDALIAKALGVRFVEVERRTGLLDESSLS